MLLCAAYVGAELTDMEKGLDLLGLPSIWWFEGKPKGEPSCPVEMGESVSVADWGGVKVKPPNAGLMPVGDMCESIGPRLNVSMLNGRIILPSGKPGVYDPGEVKGVPSPWVLPKGECSAWVMSKSSGNALDLIIRSRSSLVKRFSFARLCSC